MLAQFLPAQSLLLIGLHPQELLLIVPFVERARLVETLVALEPDEFGLQNFGEHLGDFGLAGARGPFDQQRLLERQGEKDRGLDALIGDVARPLEPVGDLLLRQVHLLSGPGPKRSS